MKTRSILIHLGYLLLVVPIGAFAYLVYDILVLNPHHGEGGFVAVFILLFMAFCALVQTQILSAYFEINTLPMILMIIWGSLLPGPSMGLVAWIISVLPEAFESKLNEVGYWGLIFLGGLGIVGGYYFLALKVANPKRKHVRSVP